MAKHESRITEKRREYQGGDAAEVVINWLNAPRVPEWEKARVRMIIALYRNMFGENAAAKDRFSGGDDRYWHEICNRHPLDRLGLKNALNKALSYYWMVPAVSMFGPWEQPSECIVSIIYKPAPGSRLARNPEEIRRSPMEQEPRGTGMHEVGAIRNVLDLMQSGSIFKVSRCSCGKFYFRKFSHQRFCSEKCRIAEFRTSDEARRKRNEYARKLYHLHKTGKVK